ncbi:thiamine-phosphate kinase [Mariniphaga anaerophila]|uniref:Thiamine-monophosphate kinase n=1 Tax=Mariniphaga anaerophila TaxID=1484053 RepID=A0A1M4VTX4_9BACT|nr:thiamine-phosphate kinase [Mariniphaga anaerophila]SHE72484.1 thiamine-phosphate kinase [Mariniphaga anaerophila]
MELKEIGEFGFIERFAPEFKTLLSKNVMGIGDDCAILPMNENSDLLVTTDMLIEEIHFLRDKITPWQLGYKSVAVNLSDIAAMGGTPLGTFLSIAIPPGISVEYLDEFMNGYHAISDNYETPLYGGDTTRSVKHLAINVCAIGKCPKGEARLRRNAKTGDLICVTGNLGDSAGGLQSMLSQLKTSEDIEYLLQRHHLPEPQMKAGQTLLGFSGVHAMLDISDGIASDLVHILKASKKSAHINLEKLPLSDPLKRVCELQNWSPEELASGGGEDYELLFTLAPEQLNDLQKAFSSRVGKPFYVIGEIENGEPVIQWYKNGQKVAFSKAGFNHFQE